MSEEPIIFKTPDEIPDELVKTMLFNMSMELNYVKLNADKVPKIEDNIDGLYKRKTDGAFSRELKNKVDTIEIALNKLIEQLTPKEAPVEEKD